MGRTLLSVQIAFAGCVVAFAVLPFTIFSYVILFGVGATLLVVFALISSLVQLTVPNELRGRVLSIYLVAFRGGTPIGSLISGYFIGLSSASTVLAVNGLLLAAVAALFLIRSRELQEL
jgi:predicted MFS family arabinose efflux permease